MIHTLKIGGAQRPVLFGTAAFRRIKAEIGLTVTDVQLALRTMDWTIVPDLLYHALRVGELAKKQEPGDYSVDDVALWIDQEPQSAARVLEWFADATLDLAGVDEETKKKVKEGLAPTDQTAIAPAETISTGQP